MTAKLIPGSRKNTSIPPMPWLDRFHCFFPEFFNHIFFHETTVYEPYVSIWQMVFLLNQAMSECLGSGNPKARAALSAWKFRCKSCDDSSERRWRSYFLLYWFGEPVLFGLWDSFKAVCCILWGHLRYIAPPVTLSKALQNDKHAKR